MSYDITQKDKKLLTAMFALIIVVAFLHFGILPVMRDIRMLNVQIDDAREAVDENELKIAKIAMEEFDNVDFKNNINAYKSLFYDDMKCEGVDAYLTEMASGYGLYVYSMDINMNDPVKIAPFIHSKKAASQGIFEEERDYPVKVASVTLSLGGPKNSLWNFIDGMYAEQSAIRLCSYNWSEVNDDSGEAVKNLSVVVKIYINDSER